MGKLLEMLSPNHVNMGVGISRSQDCEEPFESEVQRWFKHHSMDIQQSSLDGCLWFKVNRTLYPRIELMACDYMGVAATSVPSECAFSQAGTVVSKRRALLGDDAVQAICELQSFLKYLKR